jgi:hypothetical protein
MKYRIKVNTLANGNKLYYPQQRRSLLHGWESLYIDNGKIYASRYLIQPFDSEEEAFMVIRKDKDDILIEKGKRVVKSGIIEII